MDLFSFGKPEHTPEPSASTGAQPLAELLRPQSFEEFLGLDPIFLRNKPLFEQIKRGEYPSLILWGPPGSGKTTLAHILIRQHKSHVHRLNAVETGAKVIRELGEVARQRRIAWGEKTLVFIDEIHRLNRAQQDVLLPFVEAGDFTLIGATTENPSHALVSALLSRTQLIVFKPHGEKSLKALITRALQHANLKQEEALSSEAFDLLILISSGDARRLLNLMESLIFHLKSEDLRHPLTDQELKTLFESAPLYYDKKGSAHYDTISAFIKSIRGSSPDAGVYYLARMLEGGEDPLFIARRLIILASEDIGNADPKALEVAVAAAQAVQMIGLPEGAISLAQAVTYLASAPKSNRSYMALRAAQERVKTTQHLPVPHHLRSSDPVKADEEYKYSHDYSRGYVTQDYLPKEIKDEVFYEPTEIGFEKKIRQYLQWLRTGKSD
ncbi:MAG: replication-associated recombination protein A [Bdellovibrionales bacterium]